MNDIEQQVRQALATYERAVLAKDVQTFMHLYDPAVRVFDTWGTWVHEGAAAWQVAIEGWFASLGSERVRVAFEDVNVLGGAGMAALSATVRYTALSAQGEVLRSMQNRLSWVLQVRGHVLRIVHEHTSAPVGFEDAKAILQRPSHG